MLKYSRPIYNITMTFATAFHYNVSLCYQRMNSDKEKIFLDELGVVVVLNLQA